MATLLARMLPLAALAALTACDRGSGTASAAAAEGTAHAGDRGKPGAASASAVHTASRPADACGWISASEVEAIVGKLTGPPRTSDGACIYPLPVDSETARRRAKALELQRKLEERFGKSDLPELVPDESAVIVDVQEYVDPAGARGAAAAGAIMAGWIGEGDSTSKPASDSAASPPPATLPGWDGTNRAGTRSFVGGLGHIQIAVRVQAAEVTREQTTALANRIRDKIPDLPFPSERTGAPASPDPCVLVTVQEVEAVVGKLVVPPFRSDEGKPLAMENGASCTYYTAGHHALVLTPTWSYGGSAFEAMRGVGGMLEGIAPTLHNDAADTLDTGPWEDAAGDPATGSLYFLKGDRALEVHYLVSTTDMDGAVRLARIAVERL